MEAAAGWQGQMTIGLERMRKSTGRHHGAARPPIEIPPTPSEPAEPLPLEIPPEPEEPREPPPEFPDIPADTT